MKKKTKRPIPLKNYIKLREKQEGINAFNFN